MNLPTVKLFLRCRLWCHNPMRYCGTILFNIMWKTVLVGWWFVHRMHNRYYFNSSLYSFISVLNFQIVLDTCCGDVQLLVTFQLSWALGGCGTVCFLEAQSLTTLSLAHLR